MNSESVIKLLNHLLSYDDSLHYEVDIDEGNITLKVSVGGCSHTELFGIYKRTKVLYYNGEDYKITNKEYKDLLHKIQGLYVKLIEK